MNFNARGTDEHAFDSLLDRAPNVVQLAITFCNLDLLNVLVLRPSKPVIKPSNAPPKLANSNHSHNFRVYL